jgi:hypothetical protein
MLAWFGYAADTAGPELADLLNDTRAQGREEGFAIALGIVGMAEAIRARPWFRIGLCESCASRSTLRCTNLISDVCERCGADGAATPSGGVWVYA